ncbi:ABC transporter ATP-binding protein [Mycolicibacterium smegmatis]|jgi:sulfonate transport system ATP-binding protein|uniref:ABC transporter ATP-binding protein n=1 Tax=Mycolicibacterium smegmatis TaxID=1772 RepID=UPI0005D93D06|nr:ABC transporter ATP-binding protein [Mycolicibacterium smegmatis]MDF1897393.1 ABC transporter ATP-binding protein [Mycolicibacterium smegmatis]MDF1904164.1 ABC transporter ATP-binding protein [Mycolicibacterium smegmatis]MDF1916959.1 ABC transporter ATP-binding protein [Mycolicibacterium smegmatis]MDF1922333.1 ABC transporter ATP-binding protein [Mycolicibacterium smegmatis]UAK56236.1 ABC transporter ATP-binding protein [Mycolicibacterium smegmatis]
MTVTDAPSQTVIELNGLSKQFGNQVILDDFALTVRKGEFVALLGRSGTGKTTLLRILAGLEDATSGHLRITPRSSVVFQEPRLIQAQRVWKNVVLSTSRSDEVYRRALDALTEVGLADKAKAWPKSLSGGEAQRVGLARALFRSPELLLLDEPFGALDAFTRRTAQDLVTTLWQEHQVGVLLVTHDIEEAVLLADRIVVLGHGTIQADIPVHLDRPRDVTSAEFNDIKRAVLNSLAIPSPEAQQDSAGQ